MANLNVLGVSYHHHLPTAISETIASMTEKLSGRLANLILVFSTFNLTNELTSNLKNQSPQAQIIGMRVSHLTLNNQNPTLALIGIHPQTVRIVPGIGTQISANPLQAINQITSQILGSSNNQPPIELLLLNSQPARIDTIFNSLYTNLNAHPPSYLMTCPITEDHSPTIFFDNQLLSDSLIALGIYNDSFISAASYQTSTPIGVPQKITQFQGNIIHQVNNLPATTLYEQYLPNYKLARLPLSQLYNLTSSFPICLFTSPQLTFLNPLGITPQGGLILPIDLPPHLELVSLATQDLSSIENHINQTFTSLNQSNCTISLNTLNRHADVTTEQAETDLIQQAIQSDSLLTVTVNDFSTATSSAINFNQPGRMVLNLI